MDGQSEPLPQLPKEVWTVVAQHLRQSNPRPGAVKDRKEIRQLDLVALMRCSKLLNNATAIVLYSNIITDDLSGLYHNYKSDTPVAPGILSKKELLLMARELHIEYPDRELSDRQSMDLHTYGYMHARRHPKDPHSDFGFYIQHPALATLVDVEQLFLSDPSSQLHITMPELSIVSCATFVGSLEDEWLSNFGGSLGYMTRVREVQIIFTRMFLQGKVKHFCQTGKHTPLCLHPVELFAFKPMLSKAASSASNTPQPALAPMDRTVTMHVDLRSCPKGTNCEQHFSVSICPFGLRVRWCFENARPLRAPAPGSAAAQPFLDFPSRPPFAEAMFVSMASGLGQGHDARDASPRPTEYRLIPFHVDAYIPMTDATATMLLQGAKVRNSRGATAKEKSANKRSAAAQRLGVALYTELFETDTGVKHLHPDDHFDVHHIADAPTCPACGWLPAEN